MDYFKNNELNYKYFTFCYDNYKIKAWFKRYFTDKNIESLVLSLLNNAVSSDILYDVRNKINLISSEKIKFVNQDIVVKNFCLSRKYDQLRFRFLNSKAFRSINMAIKIKKIGLNTPDPLVAIECRGKLNRLVKSYYISSYVDYDYNLLSIVSDDSHPLRDKVIEFLPQIAKDIRKMHDAGIIHNDMHAGNILVKNTSKEPTFYYIDLNRAREKKKLSLRLRMKDIARFDITETEMKVFLKNYIVNENKLHNYLKELKRQRDKKVKIKKAKKFLRSLKNRESS